MSFNHPTNKAYDPEQLRDEKKKFVTTKDAITRDGGREMKLKHDFIGGVRKEAPKP